MQKRIFAEKAIFYIFGILIFLRFIFDGLTYPEFNLIYTLGIFLLFIIFISLRSFNINLTNLELIFLFFIIGSIISSSLSVIKGSGVRFNSYIVSYLCLYLLTKNILLKDKEKETFIFVILFCVLLISIYGIYQRFWGLEATRKYLLENKQLLYVYDDFSKYISPTFIHRMLSNRVFSTFVYPNIYASFLITIMPFLFFLFLDKFGSLLSLVSILLFFLCFFNLLLTESMGGLLIFLFIFHLIFLYIIFENKKFKNLLPFIFSFECFLFFLGYKFEILPHIHSLKDRIFYWKASVKIIPINPILGIGPENFKYYFLKYKLPEGLEAKYAHNLFIQTIVENGILGFFLLFSFLIALIIKVLKSKKHGLFSIGAFFSLLAFLMHNLIDFGFYDSSLAILFFLIGGMIQNKDKLIPERLTKCFLYFIIILVIACGIKLIKFENSERYRKLSRREYDFNVKIYYLERAENWDNKNFEVFFDKGNLYLNFWKATKEERFLNSTIINYNRVIELNPYFIKAYRELAYLYEEIKNYTMAEKMFLKLIELYPNKKLYHLEIARFYKKIGEDGKFNYFYQKSKELKGVNIEEGILIERIEKWIKLQK